jgi:hypothetical protein
MKQLFGQIALVFSLSFFGNASAKQMYCHPGWAGGDHGYDAFVEVIVSDKPILSNRARSEADPWYKTQKGAQSAKLSISIGWDNKETYGNNAVLAYHPKEGTKASFAKANYAFAKECLAKELSPGERKQLEGAALNPKPKRRK